MSIGMEVAGQAASSAVGGIMGLASSAIGGNQQRKNQERLIKQQVKAQKELGKFNSNLAMQTWEDTNYSAQAEQMRKAGLNVGLMYGGAGGAGGTTQGGSPGSVNGGTASDNSGVIAGTMGMGLNARMQEAQIKVAEAQADNINADTENKTDLDREIGKATIASLKQNVKSEQAKEMLNRIEYRIKDITQGATVEEIQADSRRAIAEARSAEAKGEVDSSTVKESINIIQATSVEVWLRNKLTQAQTKDTNKSVELKDAQIGKIASDIAQGWESLSIQDKQTRVNAFNAELQAEYPGVWNVAGKGADVITGGIERFLDWITGGEGERYKPEDKKVR